MARLPGSSPDDKLTVLWRSACEEYARETGTAIVDEAFPRIFNPEDLSRQLDAENGRFQDFRTKKSSLFHAIQMVLSPFENWGDVITDAVSASFPPASCIMGAMMLLIRGARKVSESFDMLTDLFYKLGNFSLRLESYKGVPLSEGMRTIIVKVLVNVFRVCAASQKLLNRGSLRTRVTKWAKNVFVDDTSISSLLGELEELTSQEHKMVSAHGLALTNQALRNTAKLLQRDDERNDRERLDKLKKALDPVSASGQVFSSINESRMPGSGSWVEERIRSWWQGSESLLWIHGGPGVGKSYMASKIINDLAKAETSAGFPPIVASFFIKNNDVDLRSLNKALRTLAWQVAVRQSSFAAHAEEYCLKEDIANSYDVWRKLLLEYFSKFSPDVGPCCFVIDGIDEADPEEQEILFSLLESTHSAEDETAPVRVIFLGRDSIRGVLEEHNLDWIPEIEINNNQNKDDLHRYVSQKLQKTKLFRDASDFQDEVIREICAQAEGLWEWANLVIKSVTRCRTKEQIRKVIRTIPRGISAMLHAELQRLGKELSVLDATLNDLADELSDKEGASEKVTATRTQQLSILLTIVTKARKPFSVDQLGYILEILLDEEVLNLEDDLHKVYSSLFSLRPAGSFYEFFSKSVAVGPIHVDLDQAEALFLYVLLHTLSKRRTEPMTEKLWHLNQYAQKFLPMHLSNANPETATNREDIARLFETLFTEEFTFNPVQIAEIQCLEKTPIWHARVAQAMLHHHAYSAALEQFQSSLDKNNETPILSEPAIAIIHRDMARSCTEVGKYKEALEHSSLAESLQEEDSGNIGDKVGKLLNLAQVEYYAKLTDKAIATLEEAWKVFAGQEVTYRDYYSYTAFFSSFFEFHQPHRIRPAFDFALTDLRGMQSTENEMDDFIARLLDIFTLPRMLYRVFQCLLMDDDRKYIDLLVSINTWLDSNPFRRVNRPAEAKYYLGSLMFEYGLFNQGIRVWYELNFLTPGEYDLWSREAQPRSRSRLAGVCLYHPDIPSYEEAPLLLDESDESGDICLFVSSWLRDHDDAANARVALRGRVKSFTKQFPNDRDFIDDISLIGLFNTFLIATDCDEDLNEALYLLKVGYEEIKKRNKEHLRLETAAVAQDHKAISGQHGDSENASQLPSADGETQETTEEVPEDQIYHILDDISECAHCKCDFYSICHWYFCRSCPLMKLCRRCYRDMQSTISNADTASHFQGICDPRHEFFYSGPPLRPDECVPEGLMVLQSPDGEKQTINIGEWKEKLSEKWETADFVFEGGLSSWCMQVLPEPQRSRWATFFKT
ncbi:uncharacterized protein BHQ10_004329 [Talaromyces amestolkiae]|uniref:Fungal STAND N-terminal Goodbye domain-containing protein n=1 Tax=Talaromyces amestolkiae TaxID=1196081 RepID=A0A364KXN8_TALAM|nr:uncharacterized protein BHQ10_004329 [Talaromyces amestolkiae]RAO68317.1 hypothetical protein BHQ10_004329 [Talaromyces amestolkiae]